MSAETFHGFNMLEHHICQDIERNSSEPCTLGQGLFLGGAIGVRRNVNRHIPVFMKLVPEPFCKYWVIFVLKTTLVLSELSEYRRNPIADIISGRWSPVHCTDECMY